RDGSYRGRVNWVGARTKARKRAVDRLFEAESRGVDAGELARERGERPVTPAALNPYTVTAVQGVVEHWAEIDEALTTYSQGWSLERMPDVDRAILRSEEHTSELQSRFDLVCRLLLEETMEK